jgi:K+ transporter
VYSPVPQVGDAEQGLKSLWVSGTIPTLRTMPVGERWSQKQLLEVLSTPDYGIVRTNACNVFMTPKRDVVPPSIQSLARTCGCLPRTIVLLTIAFNEHIPFMNRDESKDAQFEVVDLYLGVYRIVLTFGYAESLTQVQYIRHALGKVARMHCDEFPALQALALLTAKPVRDSSPETLPITSSAVDTEPLFAVSRPSGDKKKPPSEMQYESSVTFVINRRHYVTRPGHSIWSRFRVALYRLMVLNARKPTAFFGLPPDCTMEVSSIRFL